MTIKVDLKELTKTVANLKGIKKEVMIPAAAFMKSITPYRSGNAQRNTYLDGTDIVANYPYAERLDNGWSKQAPDGMTGKTMDEIEKLVEKFIANKGK